MSQNSENTWSATDAKDNQQEIVKLVSIHLDASFFVFWYLRHAKMVALIDGINSWNQFLDRHLGGRFVVEEGRRRQI